MLILTGHYLLIYILAQSFEPRIYMIDAIRNSPFAFLIDPSYWLYLFFVVSGYLVSKTRITGIGDLVRKSVKRFFRLGLPILFSYFVIYLLYLCIGFHTKETDTLFTCQWYQQYFTETYSLKDVLLSPYTVIIQGKYKLNPPYWVLRNMYLSSLIIYAIKYCWNKLNSPVNAVSFSVLMVISLSLRFASPIFSACLIGMMISLFEIGDISLKSFFSFWIVLLAWSLYFLPNDLKAAIFFSSLILCIPRIKWLNSLFISKPIQYLGKISWGIYSFHWPVMCSVSALTLIKLAGQIGLIKSYCISFIIALAVSLLLSNLFNVYIEKPCGLLINKADDYIQFNKGSGV